MARFVLGSATLKRTVKIKFAEPLSPSVTLPPLIESDGLT